MKASGYMHPYRLGMPTRPLSQTPTNQISVNQSLNYRLAAVLTDVIEEDEDVKKRTIVSSYDQPNRGSSR
jgi:hypothetical protein